MPNLGDLKQAPDGTIAEWNGKIWQVYDDDLKAPKLIKGSDGINNSMPAALKGLKVYNP